MSAFDEMEPQAIEHARFIADHSGKEPAGSVIAMVSASISLKRIADALCEGTAAIHVHLNTDGVAGGGLDFSDVAFRAGVAFQNGVNNAR